ncbi:MAG: hypothetical protein NZ843_01475, partial [Fimbriimonadales bacterium]|nr:hypothetical protein [Fimbriimonadales bacterium]
MGRMWGVLWGGLTLCACMLADSNATPPRVNGMLWAGTTFQLRATASVEDQLIATSESAQVRVGQVIRWESTLQSPTGRSWVPGSSPPEFRVRVINRGNGWDNLALTLQQYETVESFTWNTELLEMHPNGRQVRVQGGMGSLIEPGQGVDYVVRLILRNRPTDGAWARLSLTARGASTLQIQGDFVAGAVIPEWVRTRAWCYGDHAQLVAPILYQGRLVWMGTNVNSRETRIFLSRDSVESTRPDASIGNDRIVYGRALRDFVPTGFSVGLGDGWFTGRGNQLIRIDLQRVVNNNTSSDPFSVVQFPPGILPRLDLEPLVFNGRLYVAGSDLRLHAILPEGLRAGQSMPMPASYGAFSTNLVHIGRIFYIGTENGWVVQFDAATGSLRTARRVSNQRLHSLAVAPLGRVLLARVGNREVVALNPNQLNLLWRRTLNEDLVSP